MAANPPAQIDFRGVLSVNYDNTYSTNFPNGDKPQTPSPTYTPIFAFDFNGTNGNSASQAEFSPEPDQSPLNSITYSNDIAGPHGQTITAKQSIVAYNAANDPSQLRFGGSCIGGAGLTIANGDRTFFGMHVYFPDPTCFAYGAAGDGYGSLKFARYGPSVGANRITHQLGLFQNGGVDGCGLNFNQSYTSFEANDTSAITPSPQTLNAGQWNALCWEILWQESATGYTRTWANGNYLGEVSNIATKPAGIGTYNDFTIGDYFNGGAFQAMTFYIQSLILTKEVPNTLDSGGRPYISPDTQVGDFA